MGETAAASVYRHRSTIEAAGPITRANMEQIAEWCGSAVNDSTPSINGRAVAIVGLVNGSDTWGQTWTAALGEYVVRNPISNRFHPIPADLFEALCELTLTELFEVA